MMARYGYRYYDFASGRWTSRDPAEDLMRVISWGHLDSDMYSETTAYSMVGNDPILNYDLLGLVCGTSLIDWIIPDAPGGYDFTSACQNHDDCYGKCGSMKSDCDDRFKADMNKVCDEQPQVKEVWCTRSKERGRRTIYVRYKCKLYPQRECRYLAALYYNVVKYAGHLAFGLAQLFCDKCKEGAEDED